MDYRKALKPHTQLVFHNENGEKLLFVIGKEIGRGRSCLVYEAARVSGTGEKSLFRVKELYPYNLNLQRAENGILSSTPELSDAFALEKKKFREDFSRANSLYYLGTNYASMTNQLDLFPLNGTLYSISSYSSDKTLASYTPPTVKECIDITKQIAYVLGKLHEQGYLYLDLKPENILVVDGYQKTIQLFDFDSLICIPDISREAVQQAEVKLSFSKGYAPLELQTFKIRKIGPHTDVYELGALLYYLLFGKTPASPEGEWDCTYDFSLLKQDCTGCDDRLTGALTQFFHKTLAVYYADRYGSMQEALDFLQTVGNYADATAPRLFSSTIIRPGICLGRENQLKQLDAVLSEGSAPLVCITGMGGIGKSTFIREYLSRHKNDYDFLLYMYFKDSIEATIADDKNVFINTLHREENEKNGIRYFDKKIRKMWELTEGTNSILVIDNYTGAMDEGLSALLRTGCKVVLVSRQAPFNKDCCEIRLDRIEENAELRLIFENNLGRKIRETELDAFYGLVRRVKGHTLVLELMAKQVANSHITLEEALAIVGKEGLTSIAAEKVDYEKDSRSESATVGNIMDTLFESSHLTSEKKMILKTASVLGEKGIDITLLQKILDRPTKDDINELIKSGWLSCTGDTVTMHNVIQEAIHRWKWEPEYICAVNNLLAYFYVEIRLESSRTNLPEKQRKINAFYRKYLLEEVKDNKRMASLMRKKERGNEDLRKTIREQASPGWLIWKTTRERFQRENDESPTDFGKLSGLIDSAQDILKQCRREEALKEKIVYQNLLYLTVINTHLFKDDAFLSEADALIGQYEEKSFISDSTDELLNMKTGGNPEAIMKLYWLTVPSLAENGFAQEAASKAEKAGKLASRAKNTRVYAYYYDMLADYYDILLSGAYDAVSEKEKNLRNKLLKTIDQTLYYSKKICYNDVDHIYARSLLSKATILLRSNQSSGSAAAKLINEAGRVILKATSQYADVRLYYNLVCAWFYALTDHPQPVVDERIKTVLYLSDKILPTDLRKIEEVILPCANIYYEMKCHRDSLRMLFSGIQLCCEKHLNFDSYARIRQELFDHYFEVGLHCRDYELCAEMIHYADTANEGIKDAGNRIIIGEELRNLISDT